MCKMLTSLRVIYCLLSTLSIASAADWPQLQGNSLRSGNAPEAILSDSLGLLAAIPLTDGIYASPVVSNGSVFVIDGAGVVFAIDAATSNVKWRYQTAGGSGNCNNVA